MQSLDPTVASILDKTTTNTPPNPSSSSSSEDEDTLISLLENDTHALSSFREQRLQQLHTELSRAKEMRNQEYGIYSEIKDEKILMDIITTKTTTGSSKEGWAVVHFFKDGFERCGVMDGGLENLAPKHFDTRFLRINVENAPFLVTKLKIQVLPCVLAFVNGISVDRIVGFEGLGYSEDSFTVRDLEARLIRAGVLVRAKTIGDGGMPKSLRHVKKEEKQHDSEDDDWD
ncbi:MAG: hypothetical protein M1812_003820 [Candelaria pacifica]|nr:MAG: hypothetical protein M1812_003820 [Candelaria pacifica]